MTTTELAQPLLRDVTDAEVRQYRRDGVVCLRRIIAPEWVELMREGAEEQRRRPGPHSTVVEMAGAYALVDQQSSRHNANLMRMVREGGVGEIIRRMLDTDAVHLVDDEVFYKESGRVLETPWHQDTNGAIYSGRGLIRLWLPLDPIPRQTSIEVVRASHLWNVSYKSPNIEQYKAYATDGATSHHYFARQEEPYPDVPDIERHRESFDIVGYDVVPGDAVVFSYHLLHHAGGGVGLANKRRAYAIILGDADCTLENRPNAVPSPLTLSGRNFVDGQSMRDFPEEFPLI